MVVLALTCGAGLAGGAVIAQEQCGAYPVGQDSYACACPAGFSQGSVWGSGPYTADSSVCTAALHAGVVGVDGGKVLALATGPGESFVGSAANGVTSRDWGSYPNTFAFDMPVSAAAADLCGSYPLEAETYTCTCDAVAAAGGGLVWGSSPYTADSDICTAAVHGGLIGPEGGIVTVLRTAGLPSYFGSEINGVATFDWSSDPVSFVFDYNQ
jgi:hypothetical protein